MAAAIPYFAEPRQDWLQTFASGRRVVPALFVLALGLRLVLILLLPQQPFSDGAYYFERAVELAAGLGYQEEGHPTAFWPVGYPAALAGSMLLFGPNLIGPMLLNLCGAAVILWLILWFGRYLAGSETVARLAAALYAVYPAHIAYTGAPLSETVSTAVVLTAFALLIRGRRSIPALLAAGLLFGIATLMRAQTLAFPIGAAVALLIVYRDFRWTDFVKAVCLLHLALAAAVLPWSLRNQAVLGEFVMVSTNGGVGLHAGANDLATGAYFQVNRSPLWQQVNIPWEQRVVRQVELDRRLSDLAIEWIAQDPLRWLALGPNKLFFLWEKDSDAFWTLKSSHPHLHGPLTALQWLNQFFYMALLGLAAFAFWGWARALFDRGGRLDPMALLMCMPAFVSITAFFFTGQTRYHYPAMPLIIVAAAWTLVQLGRLPSSGRAIR